LLPPSPSTPPTVMVQPGLNTLHAAYDASDWG